MSVKSINRMVKEIDQLKRHKGKYYRKWLRNYTKWVKQRSAKSVDSNKLVSRWLAGMNRFVAHPKR